MNIKLIINKDQFLASSDFFILLLFFSSNIAFGGELIGREWTRLWGGSDDDVYGYVKVSDDGDVYVAGHSCSAIDGQQNIGSSDMVLSKWSFEGDRIWTREWGSSNLDTCCGLQIDSSGMIYVVGSTQGSFDGQVNSGAWDMVLTKWSSDGEKIWTRIWGGTLNDDGLNLALDSAGNIYVAGTTYNSFDDEMNSGDKDVFLTKWLPDGTMEWVRVRGSSELDSPGAPVCVGGNIYVPGHTWGTWGGETNSGGIDASLTKWSSSGVLLWTRVFGGSSHDYARGVVEDSEGYIYTQGSSLSYIAGNPRAGEYDFFVTKWSPEGLVIWHKLWGTPQRDSLKAITLCRPDRIFIAGTTGYPDHPLDLVLTELSTEGDILWSTKWGSPESELLFDMDSFNDRYIYVSGWTQNTFDGQFSHGGSDIYFSKYNLNYHHEILDLKLSPTNSVIKWSGVRNCEFTVESSTNLLTWETSSVLTNGTEFEVMSYTNLLNKNAEFYRVKANYK